MKPITVKAISTSLAEEHGSLINRVNELLDKTRNTDLPEGYAFRRDLLDYLNRLGLAGNSIYSAVERAHFLPVIRVDETMPEFLEMIKFYEVLEFFKTRLELAPSLIERNVGTRRLRPQRFRRRTQSRVGPNYPPLEADSKKRAGTVARLRRELERFPPKLSEHEYEQLKESHSRFLTFYIADNWSDIAKPLVMNMRTGCHKPLLQTAQTLAALYHNKEEGTIQDDWKKRNRMQHK